MVIWKGGRTVKNDPERIIGYRLDTLASQQDLILLLSRFCGHLIRTELEHSRLNDGLAKGWLQQGEFGFINEGLLKRARLRSGYQNRAIGRDKEQHCAEDNRTHSDTHDDVDRVVPIRHDDLLSSESGKSPPWRSCPTKHCPSRAN